MSIANGRLTFEPDVLVVGAGPVGLWLALELNLGGASVTVVEKRQGATRHSRALTIQPRTLEVLASRGHVDLWLNEGNPISTTHYAMLASRLDLSSLPTDYPFALFLPQNRTEQLLEQLCQDAGIPILRGVTATGLTQTESHVQVQLAGHDDVGTVIADYVVGCDGRRSIVRAESGIGYTGSGNTITCTMADLVLDNYTGPASVTLDTESGSLFLAKIDDQYHRIVGIDRSALDTPVEAPLTLGEFRETILRLTDIKLNMRDPIWLTRVGSATFQADRYHVGRAFLAGDAAHIHMPMGGQGLNVGLQDATNLGWKMAAVLRSDAAPALLNTYGEERIPVGAELIESTLAQTALVAAPGREGKALRDTFAAALRTASQLNAKLATLVSGIGTQYGVAGDDVHVGKRLPNLKLIDGSTTDESLTKGQFCAFRRGQRASHRNDGRGLINFVAEPLNGPAEVWNDVEAALIRPDGHIVWTTSEASSTDAELEMQLNSYLKCAT